MPIVRLILSYLTFPGVIAHEFAHAWACRRLGIRVLKVCYLRFGNPLGYVLHEAPASAIHHILVAVAPAAVSTLLALAGGVALCGVARSPLSPELRDGMALFLAWVSFSCALHAFPSSGDADSLWQEARGTRAGFMAMMLLVPAVAVIRVVQLGARFGLDLVFALVIVALPPVVLLAVTA